MNFYLQASTRKIMAVACAVILAGGIDAHGDVEFPASSPLSQGHWVKISFPATGVYEITFEQLREMGFDNPERVGIFGHGGHLQPMQFVDAQKRRIYDSSLPPVAMLRTDSKIIFFGQGPALLRHNTKNAGNNQYQQIELASENTYASEGCYYLTDSREDALIPRQADGLIMTGKPSYTHAWSVQYHNNDLVSPIASGRELLGENLRAGALSFPFAIPGAKAGDEAGIFMRAAHMPSGSPGALNVTLSSGVDANTASLAMRSLSTGDYYSTNGNGYFSTFMPGAEGTLGIEYTGSSSWAYLDYYIITAHTRLSLPEGQPSMMAFVSDYNRDTYGRIDFAEAPDDMVIWDVSTPNKVSFLPWDDTGDGAYARYLTSTKSEGLMVAFSPSATQLPISSWSEVRCADLHSLGRDQMPALLIITLPELVPAAERIADLHKRMEGINTAIVLSDDVINEFSAGVPDPMAYRALAKMLYDRDNPDDRTFKNILLLGPCVRDQRNILGMAPKGTLICNQSFLGRHVDDSYTLNDWYGMMGDYTTATPDAPANDFIKVPMEIGVGNLPASNLQDAYTYIDKLEAFYNDDSLAYWLNESTLNADGTNNNEHQNDMESLYRDFMSVTGNTHTGAKLYNNLYPAGGTTKAFCRNLARGSLLNFYLGHADATGLNDEFWKFSKEQLLYNNRLGFMLFGGCTITAFDNNYRGSGESLVFHPKEGLIGGFMSTRSAYSYSNFVMIDLLMRSLFLEKTSGEDRITSPLTIGEAYARAKTAYQNNSNKLAYVLISDPALTLPVSTADIDINIDGSATVESISVYPGSELKIEGSIAGRGATDLSAFSGTAVAKLYAAPASKTTASRYGSPSVTVTVDETPISVSAFEIKNGHFSGSILLPESMSPCTEGATATLRIAAFDPSVRIGASGAISLDVQPYDESKVVETDNAPCIESMYMNSPDVEEGEPVPPGSVLHADITDDYGVMIYEVEALPGLTLTIDDRRVIGNLSEHATLSDEGRRCHLAYKLADLEPGLHTIALHAKDANGHMSSSAITVCIGSPMLEGALSTADEPARDSAIFTLTMADEVAGLSRTLVVMDAAGNEILSVPMEENTYEWGLSDAAGNRVPAGIYTAVCRLSAPGLSHGATAPCSVTVF